MIVLDASAVADFLLERGPSGEWVADRVRSADSLHAPHLLDVEVAAVVRRRALGGALSGRRGRVALQDLADLRLTRYAATPLLDRIWELRANLTAHDASYVALAEALAAPLVSTDARIAEAPGHGARVEVPL